MKKAPILVIIFLISIVVSSSPFYESSTSSINLVTKGSLSKKENSFNGNDVECFICFDELNIHQTFRMVCGHSCHLKCILEWKRRKNSCPFCSLDLSYTIFDAIKEKNINRFSELIVEQHYLKGEDGKSIINICLEERFVEGAKIFIINDYPFTNPSGLYNITPLQLASHYNYISIVKLILDRNPPLKYINAINSVGNQSALHLAANCGNYQILKILVRYGANSKLKDVNGHLPIDLAINNGHTECVSYLAKFNWYYCGCRCFCGGPFW